MVVDANMADDLAKMMELLQRPELDTSDEQKMMECQACVQAMLDDPTRATA